MDPRWDRRVRLSPRGACGVCEPPMRRHDGRPRPNAGRASATDPENAVLSWVRGLPGAPGAQLDRLRVLDGALASVFGESLDLRDGERRLAFALFLEFARHHGLSAGEAALLLPEPLAAARDAIDALSSIAAEPPRTND